MSVGLCWACCQDLHYMLHIYCTITEATTLYTYNCSKLQHKRHEIDVTAPSIFCSCAVTAVFTLKACAPAIWQSNNYMEGCMMATICKSQVVWPLIFLEVWYYLDSHIISLKYSFHLFMSTSSPPLCSALLWLTHKKRIILNWFISEIIICVVHRRHRCVFVEWRLPGKYHMCGCCASTVFERTVCLPAASTSSPPWCMLLHRHMLLDTWCAPTLAVAAAEVSGHCRCQGWLMHCW